MIKKILTFTLMVAVLTACAGNKEDEVIVSDAIAIEEEGVLEDTIEVEDLINEEFSFEDAVEVEDTDSL